ncbi:MAG: acyl-CoA thioesterase [Leptolinea sp.]|jgi:dienelactone hydrolase|nr:acyl-CoA thioesterase [Leptolinea sp.]
MKLQIQPLAALSDKKLDIIVSGVPPKSRVRLNASMRFPWAKDVLYESAAWFTADKIGEVNLSLQKPDEGSYDFIDPMGLVVSVKSRDPKALQKIAQHISINEIMYIEFSAECEGEKVYATVERYFKASDIKSKRILDEFIGELFYTDDPGRPTILFIGGSGSGLDVDAPISAALASHGFNVLSVSFIGEYNLPPQLSRVPLEYFEKVIDWIKQNPITRGKDIWLLGMSKGAEVALILASRHSEITRVALWAPHAYCFQGIAFKNESSWTDKGIDVPYIRIKNRWVFRHTLDCFVKNRPFGYTPVYQKSLEAADNKEEARIRVENSKADFLFFTSKDCGMWNTYDGSVDIMDTLRKNEYPHNYALIVYDEAGEPYYVPYVIPASETSVKIFPRLVFSTGGTLQGNAHAREDAWEKTIEFFKKPFSSR